MHSKVFALYSAGGFAREIVASAETYLNMRTVEGKNEIIFVDDDTDAQGSTVHGHPVISYDEAKTIPNIKMNIAFASPFLRRQKYEQCERDGLSFFSIYAPTAHIGENVSIGSSPIFAHLSCVTADAKIGTAFHCNIYSYVAHDCIVGDFVTFAPQVALNGRIKVEDDVYVGSGATFLPGKPGKYLTIGKGAVIGARALVTKDVDPYTTVVGSPARPRTT